MKGQLHLDGTPAKDEPQCHGCGSALVGREADPYGHARTPDGRVWHFLCLTKAKEEALRKAGLA